MCSTFKRPLLEVREPASYLYGPRKNIGSSDVRVRVSCPHSCCLDFTSTPYLPLFCFYREKWEDAPPAQRELQAHQAAPQAEEDRDPRHHLPVQRLEEEARVRAADAAVLLSIVRQSSPAETASAEREAILRRFDDGSTTGHESTGQRRPEEEEMNEAVCILC